MLGIILQVRALSSDLCVDTLGHSNGVLGMYYCHGKSINQIFRLSGNGILYNDENCVYPKNNKVHIKDCRSKIPESKWSYDEV